MEKEHNKLVDKYNAKEQTRIDDSKFLQIMINLSPETERKAIELIDKHGLIKALHESKALNIAEVKHRFSSNDVDGAYLLGVFNVSGIDGLADEIKRLKALKINPHNIIDSIKQNDA